MRETRRILIYMYKKKQHYDQVSAQTKPGDRVFHKWRANIRHIFYVLSRFLIPKKLSNPPVYRMASKSLVGYSDFTGEVFSHLIRLYRCRVAYKKTQWLPRQFVASSRIINILRLTSTPILSRSKNHRYTDISGLFSN